jgi:hypothetical protein
MEDARMTADHPRVRVTTNLAFGLCLILVGTALMLDRLQLLDAREILSRYWPVALMLFGATLVAQSFQQPDPASTVAEQPMHLGSIIVWTIVAVVAWNAYSAHNDRVSMGSNETVSLFSMLSRQNQVASAPVFRGGHMTAVLGRADLDLRNTSVAAGEAAVLEVFTLMGGATLRVPEGWTVDVQVSPIGGGVRDRRNGPRHVAGSPRIIIRGFIMFGALEIRS